MVLKARISTILDDSRRLGSAAGARATDGRCQRAASATFGLQRPPPAVDLRPRRVQTKFDVRQAVLNAAVNDVGGQPCEYLSTSAEQRQASARAMP